MFLSYELKSADVHHNITYLWAWLVLDSGACLREGDDVEGGTEAEWGELMFKVVSSSVHLSSGRSFSLHPWRKGREASEEGCHEQAGTHCKQKTLPSRWQVNLRKGSAIALERRRIDLRVASL